MSQLTRAPVKPVRYSALRGLTAPRAAIVRLAVPVLAAAAEPGFVEVEKNLGALDKGVVCVKEAATRVGLD